MTSQMTFNLPTPTRRSSASRPHHRTTILTTTRSNYDRIRRLHAGGIAKIEAVNDIVSSAKGGQSVEHHMLRRSSLIRRQIAGGWNKVKVRADDTSAVECRLLTIDNCADDECSFRVTVGAISDSPNTTKGKE